MNRRQLLIVGCVGSLGAVGGTRIPAHAQQVSLIVGAAASLQEALKTVQGFYQQQQPKIRITFTLGSSGSLQQQIEQGAPIDVFIAAASRQMDALQEKGLILTETRTNLVGNELVLIAPQSHSPINGVRDLLQPTIERIAIGEPSSVPAGSYAQQALQSLKVWDDLKPKLVYGKDVRQVLSYVETGEVEAGLVYQTDARISKKVRVEMVFSPQTHSPIVYPLAVLKESENPGAAKELAQFLKGSVAQKVFQQFGFKVGS